MKFKQIIWLTFTILCMMFGLLRAEKIGDIEGLSKPSDLALDAERIYVVDGAEVHILGKMRLNQLARFGKQGEGPREFLLGRSGRGVFVFPRKDRVFVNSVGKISYFGFDGTFINAFPTGSGSRAARFQPYGDRFISMALETSSSENDFGFYLSILDRNLKPVRIVQKLPFIRQGRLEFPVVRPEYRAYRDKIILLDTQADAIKVFSGEGNKTDVIRLKLNKIEMTRQYKERVFQFFKTNPLTRDRYEMLKKLIRFKNQFPMIQNFWVADDRIYIQTFMERDEKYAFYICRLDGEILGKRFIPVQYSDPTRISPAAVADNAFYQLTEGEEDWELHRSEF